MTFPSHNEAAPIFSRVLTREIVPGNVMVKITKRVVEAAEAQEKDYLIWDDEPPGFGLRVFSSGKRSYVIQYRTKGRSRRYTLGLHGAWAPKTARREAKVQLGRVAGGDDPVEDRQLDHKAITVKELCTRYLADLRAGLILGKGGRPKKPSTIITTLAAPSATSFHFWARGASRTLRPTSTRSSKTSWLGRCGFRPRPRSCAERSSAAATNSRRLTGRS